MARLLFFGGVFVRTGICADSISLIQSLVVMQRIRVCVLSDDDVNKII